MSNFKKSNHILLGLAILIIVSVFLTGCKEKETAKKVIEENINESSLVSKGVKQDDLGNIANGQYYFDDGTNQYYSSFDKSSVAHIYKTNIKEGTTEIIFDGFGWSFIINDGWLYFSGNAGAAIDGSYNLYRIKPDGSNLELLNDTFCYSMHFYDKWLYYIKKTSWDAPTSDIYRSSLNGENEELLVSDIKGQGIIYNKKLYFLGSDSLIYVANPDGKDKKQIISENVIAYVIGQEKIIFVDSSYNIKTAKTDGSDIKIVKNTDGKAISNVNSYNDTIFYVKYDSNLFDNAKYAYPYELYSIKFDGTNDKKIYESYSWGFYINAVKDKIYVLDYATDSTTQIITAVTKNMNFDGSELIELYR